MTLTAEQFIYFAIAMITGLTVSWTMLFLCLRSKPQVLIALFADGLFLRMLTVVFIVCAAAGLAIANHLSAEASTILSGIAGYVLGSTHTERNRSRTNNRENPEEQNEANNRENLEEKA